MQLKKPVSFLVFLIISLIVVNLWLFQSWYSESTLEKSQKAEESVSFAPFPTENGARDLQNEEAVPELKEEETSSGSFSPGAPVVRKPALRTKVARKASKEHLKRGFRYLEESLPRTEEANTIIQTLIMSEIQSHAAVVIAKENLKFQSQQVMASRHLVEQTYFTYQQYANDLPVEHGSARGIAMNLPSGPVLTYVDYNIAEIPERTVQQSLSEEQALTAARSAFANSKNLSIHKQNRLYRVIDGQWEPVYDFEFVGEPTAISVHIETGKVYRENRAHAAKTISGQVGGRGVQFDPVKGRNLLLPLPYLTIKGSAGAVAETNAKGAYQINVGADRNLIATLTGRYAKVISESGGNVIASANIGSGKAINLGLNLTPRVSTTAQVNAYYHTNVVREYLKLNGVNHVGLDRSVPITVNGSLFPGGQRGTCNAYFYTGALYFFKEGGGCNNLAFDTVIYHEYGHLADDTFGGITDYGLSEGWGDVLAVLITGQPQIGENWEQSSSAPLRRSDNDYVYGQWDEEHDQGQAWAGFAWHLRAELIKKYSTQKGVELVEDLVLPGLVSNSTDIPSAVREVMVRDDNDGNLSNGTPNLEQIKIAAAKHGLTSFLTITSKVQLTPQLANVLQ
ncbi:MAG: hypothetical protein AB7F59_05145 [Bdellovibrionales bacterium]